MPLIKYAQLYCYLDLPPDAQLLSDFLQSYLSPYFEWLEDSAGITPLVSIRTRVGPPPEGVPDFSSAPLIPIDNSQGFLHCEGEVVQPGRVRWVRLRPYGATIRISVEERTIDLWAPSPASLRIPVLRVIEDVVLNEMQLGGAVVFHASGVVADDRAVLAIGHKRAGKTTFLTRLLHGFHVAKLANDNVCLTIEDGNVVAYGWPAFFKVELGTVSSNPELAPFYPAAKSALLNDDDSLWKDKQKVPLYSQQGAECFGATVASKAPLGVLLFPTFSADLPPSITQLHLSEVSSLYQFLQGVNNPNHPDWLDYNPVDETAVRDNLNRIVSALPVALPVYQIVWAPSVDDLLVRVPLLRSSKKSLRACADGGGTSDKWPPLPDHNRPDSGGHPVESTQSNQSRLPVKESRNELKEYVDKEINNLAIAVNAAFKGLLAYQGASGQIAARTEAVKIELDPHAGYESLVVAIGQALKSCGIEDGDVIVVPDKPFAVAQNRLIPLDWLLAADPKKTDTRGREQLLERIRSRIDTPVEAADLILADTYIHTELGSLATVGAYDHNRIAADVAASIKNSTDKIIDAVVSDTDTGLDVSEQLIGCVTICATPLGATRGLTIYEAMRAACAAEFTRGSDRRIPIVVCKPIPRSRLRPHIGEFRGYEGRLQLGREKNVAFA